MEKSSWKKMKEYILRYPKLAFFLGAMLVLALLVPYVVPALKDSMLKLIALCAMTAVAYTLHKYAGYIAAALSVVVCIYSVATWYLSLHPNVEYAKNFKTMEEQNAESAGIYSPGAGLRSAYFSQIMSLDQKVTVAVEKKAVAIVQSQSDLSTDIDANVNDSMLSLAGDIRTVDAKLERMMDSAGIPIPGKPLSQTLSRELPASTVVWTNVFTVPNGKTIEVCAEQTLLTTIGGTSVGPEGLPEVVTAEEAERDGYPVAGQRKLAVLVRCTDPKNGGGEVHALANNRQTWTNLSGHDLVVQMLVNDAPKFASTSTGTVKLSAILRSAPAA